MQNSISNAIASEAPLIWVETGTPSATFQDIMNTVTGKSIYRFDSLNGRLVQYCPTNFNGRSRWLTVLHDPANEPNKIIDTLEETLGYFMGVLEEPSVLIFSGSVAKNLESLFVDINYAHRTGWGKEDQPFEHQFIAVASSEDEFPPILARERVSVEQELPDVTELLRIAETVEDKDCFSLAEAGLGLSEYEFRTNLLRIIHREGQADIKALHEFKRNYLRGNDILDLRQPTLGLDDLGGMDNAKKLVEQVAWTWNNPELIEEFGIEPLRKLLLVGVPGTGKSLACEAIATTLDIDLAKGGISQSMSKWVGESEKNVREMFKALKVLAPIVLWIDEFGRDLAGGDHDGGTANRSHGEFLTGIQELPDDVFLAAAANRIEDLPPEMLRADRFDVIMFSGFPTASERAQIFKLHLGEAHEEYDLAALASESSYFTGAEIKQVVKKVRLEQAYRNNRRPTTDELVRFMPKLKSRIWTNHKEAMLAMYEHAATEWEWASSAQEQEAEKVLRDGKRGNSVRYNAEKSAMKFAGK